MKKPIKKTSLAVSFLLLAACSSNSLYYWGDYPEQLHSYFTEATDLSAQIAKVQKIVDTAQEKGQQLAPGVYAHLGLLLLKSNQYNEGVAYLEEEVKLYPDSKQYVQFLLKKVNK